MLIYARSLDGVLEKAQQLQKKYPTIQTIAQMARSRAAYQAYEETLKKIEVQRLHEQLQQQSALAGFRAGTFSKSYADLHRFHPYEPPNLLVANTLGFETKKLKDGRWISLGYSNIQQLDKLRKESNVTVLETAKLLEHGVSDALRQLLYIAVITLLLIALMLYKMLGSVMVRALNYVLFPLGVILAVLSFSGTLSIMHLFALIIVMVAGIDYGIYMSRPEAQTDEAIYYAMLTTFAGFGVFVFSHIGALNHIGTVITLAIVTTFVLQRLQLREG